MDLNYNFASFLDALGFAQAFSFGILLILLSKEKRKCTLCLGIFLILISFKLLYYITNSIQIENVYPKLFLLPFNFSWLLFPLFFIYCQKISFVSKENITYWILIPGAFSFLIQIIIFFLPYETKVALSQSPWHEIVLVYLGIGYSWVIAIWNLIFLRKHRLEVKNHFSTLESKQLNWANIFLLYSLITSIIIHIMYFISPKDLHYRIVFAVFDLIAIYWIAFFGIRQKSVININSVSEIKMANSFINPNEVDPMTKESMEKLMIQINKHMANSEVYMNLELTIIDLANDLGVHPKKISAAINTISNKNFNSFINSYRVEKAKNLLLEKNKRHDLSIDGIGYEAGFKSKSAFYSAFKKETGITPTKYVTSTSS